MPVIPAHGGNIYQIIGQCKLGRVTDFSANINPLGLPAGVREALNNHWDALLHYPDPDCVELKIELAKRHAITPDQILIGNGSIELIYLIPQVIKPKQSLILSPSFSELERACLISGSRIMRIGLREKDNFCLNVEDIIANLKAVQLLSIVNPNNPTGILLSPEELSRLVEACQEYGVWLVVDEAFLDFVPQADKHSLINKAAVSERLIVLRSMTKFYALAGLRLGYTVANSAIISKLAELKPPWSVNQLAQRAGITALKDTDYPHKTRQLVKQQREFLLGELSGERQFKPYPTAANYLLVKLIDSYLTSGQLRDVLIDKGYLIRDCANFNGLDNSFIRLAVRKPEENRGLIEAIRECFS